jgi:hypothetical protein
VNLGLPSGLMWATMNIGANAPEENGLYFAWGETQGYTAEQVGTDKTFAWSNYQFDPVGNGKSGDITKYNDTDKKTQLDAKDDAAAVNWGNGWRMPTNEEFVELLQNCERDFTQVINNVPVLTLTSNINGNSIIFPFSGFCVDGNRINDSNLVWSSSLESVIQGYDLLFEVRNQGIAADDYSARYFGKVVRPVRINLDI